MIKLDDIPVPDPNKNKGRKRKYPFYEMKFGESFFIPNRTTDEIGGIVTNAKRKTGFTFQTATVHECPVCRTDLDFAMATRCKECEKEVKPEAGVRVWRVK